MRLGLVNGSCAPNLISANPRLSQLAMHECKRRDEFHVIGDCSTLRVHSSLEGVSVRVNSNGDHIQLTFRLTLAVWYTTPGQSLTRRPQYTRRSGIKPPGVWRECEIGTGFHRMSRLNSFINNAGRGTYRQGHLSWSVPLSIASEAVTLTLKRAPYHWNWFPYLYFL